ncbi:repressor LexA [bacterium]|nr:repressor LexA [bacterium]
MPEDLTQRQHEILTYLSKYFKEHGFVPAIREVAKRFGIYYNAARKHILNLERKGYLRRREGISRGFEILGAVLDNVLSIPVVGDVPAGKPILAEDNIEGHIALDTSFVSESSFMLRVVGDSMVGAGINNGDLVIVQQQPVVQNGEIAVVRLGDEAIVKRFYKKNSHIELVSENPNYKPIIVNKGEDIVIVGKVTGILRLF